MAADASPSTARVLVTAASKHGTTAQIAEHIAEVLRGRGLGVTVIPAGYVDAVDGYDAVVLGSAVYMGHWMQQAKEVADLLVASVPRPPVWVFSSGPLGDPPIPDEDPVDIADIVDALSPRDHRVFAGRLDKAKLAFAERAIMIAVRAPEGDFRNFDEIAYWADRIADALTGRDRVRAH